MVANIAVAPTPCTARIATSAPAFGASPHASEATANNAVPATYTFRRPITSAAEPAPSSSAASASA